jgi:hypothetical protein
LHGSAGSSNIRIRKDILTVVPEDDPLRRLTPTLADTWQLAPVCWKTLDREAAARELVALAGWVRWLATRYVLSPRTIPPCWSNHGRMVEELSALRTGWLAAFAPDARLDAPLHWHHDFDATRSRLNETVSWSGCTKDEHRGDDTARWLTIPDTGFAPQATRTWPT